MHGACKQRARWERADLGTPQYRTPMDNSHPPPCVLLFRMRGPLEARQQLTFEHPPTEEQTAITIWDRLRPFLDREDWFSEWCHLPLRQARWHTMTFRAPAGGPRPAGGSDVTCLGEDGGGSLHAATTRGVGVHLGNGMTLAPVPSSGAET